MAFFSPRLEVSGRDRNDVDDDELLEATAYILTHTPNTPLLKTLLDPLRSPKSSGGSWLLKSPRFFNRVLEHHKDFFLHTVFQYNPNPVFVSEKTLRSKDPFIAWAAQFLKKRDAPLYPLVEGSSKYLFTEVSQERTLSTVYCTDPIPNPNPNPNPIPNPNPSPNPNPNPNPNRNR